MGDERRGNLSRWTSGPRGFVRGANDQLDEIERRTSPAAPPPTQVSPTPTGKRGFWAELTNEPSSGVYSWKKKTPDGSGGLQDDPNSVTGTGDARELSISAQNLPTTTSTGGSGLIVWLRRVGVDGSGDPQYGFSVDLEDASSPKTLGPTVGTDEEQEAAFADTWSRGSDAKGVAIERLDRIAYDDAGSETLYAYYRAYTYDALGNLVSVSAETRTTIDTPEAC